MFQNSYALPLATANPMVFVVEEFSIVALLLLNDLPSLYHLGKRC